MAGFASAIATAVTITVVAAASAYAQTPVETGYRDFSFGTAVSTPTGEKPESKLWWNDGSWWGSLLHAASGQHRIYRFDTGSQAWTDTGTVLDPRTNSRADVLWDQEAQRLYVVSHIFTTSGSTSSSSSNWGKLFRYSYNSTLRTYTLEAGFPVDVTRGRSETLTIARDASHRLWVTFVESGRVKINWSLSSDQDWGAPVDLPVDAAAVDVSSDDISAIVALANGDVGVMWSNQRTDDVYFATHRSTDAPHVWQPVETALPNAGCAVQCADDHISLKADASGRVFAAVKTSVDDDTDPLVILAVRDAGWALYTVGLEDDHHTRPIVVLDEEHRVVYVFATRPESGGAIYMKTSSLDTIGFEPGAGDPFIESSTDDRTNNPTSTKQSVTSTTGLLVLASDQDSDFYLHNFLPLGGGVPSPPAAPTNLTATAVSGTWVDLAWTDGSNTETAFHVERATGAGAFDEIATLGANVTSYNDTTVVPDTAYTYRVRASNGEGFSNYSNSADVTTPAVTAGPPAQPTDLSATAVSSTLVALAWTDASSNETAFHIERATGAAAFAEIAMVGTNVTSYNDASADPSTAYTYRVRARNGDGFSDYSNPASAATPGTGTIKAMTFEGGSLTDPLTGADMVRGTVVLESGTPLKGLHAARVPGTASSYLEEDFPAGDLYVSFYLQLAALPASDVRLALISNAGTSVGNLLLRSTGELRLRAGSTTIGTAPAPLVAGQLYRLGLHQRAGDGTNAVLAAFIAVGDDAFTTPFAATSSGTWTTSADRLRLGATTGTTIDVMLDDVVLDSAAMPGPSDGTPAPPPAPTGLTATAVSSTQVDLAWTDGSSNEAAFHVERATGTGTFTEIATVGANTTTYSDNATVAETAYRYRVRASNAEGFSDYSNTADATTPGTPAPPAAPTGLTATAISSTQVNLAWTDASTNETTFHVERATGTGAFAEIDTMGANTTTYSDTTVVADTAYSYRVRTSNAAGSSEYSNTATATTPAAPALPPAAPTDLTATALSSTQVDLAWADASTTETTFHIERATGTGAFTEIDTVGADATGYSDITVVAETAYSYRVRASNAAGSSEYSNTASATTPAAPALPPAAPTDLTGVAVSSTRVDLAWTDASSNETAFHIERASGAGAFAEIATVGANIAQYSDTTVMAGTAYSYQVRAGNADGFSNYSNVVDVTTPAGGGTGTIKAMTFEGGSLTDPLTGADIVRGTVVLESGAPLKGLHAARVPNAGSSYLEETFPAAGDLYLSFYLRLAALPGSDIRVALISNAGTSVGNLLLRSGGQLRLRVGSTTIGAESAPLVAGQLYRVGLHQQAGDGTNAVLAAFLAEGDAAFTTPFAATSTGTWTTAADRLRLGTTTSPAADLLLDDVILDAVAMPGPSDDGTPAPPAAPTSLTATATASTQVDLAWTDTSSTETAFHIERATGTGTFAEIATVGADVTAYSDTSVVAETAYSYRIRASNTEGFSDYSNTTAVTTPGTPVPPAAPTGLTATALSSTRIDLAWTDASTTETTFHVERATGTGAFAEIATVGADTTAYSDTTVVAETAYSYRVRASNAAGSSEYSNTASATTPTSESSETLRALTFEGGSLTDPLTGADTVRGTVVLESNEPLKGLHSARVPGTSASYVEEEFEAADDVYVSFYLQLTEEPTANARIALISNSGTSVGNILLRSNGQLSLRVGSTTVGTEGVPLVVGETYRIGVRQQAGDGSTAVLEAYLASNGDEFDNPFATIEAGGWTTDADRLRVGSTTSAAIDLIVDDITIATDGMPGSS